MYPQRVSNEVDHFAPLALIERAQYAHNPKLYVKGGVPELAQEGFDGSWLEWFLKETESMHGEVTGRS